MIDYATAPLEQLHALKSLVGDAAREKIEAAIADRTGPLSAAKRGHSFPGEQGVPEKEVQKRINQRLRQLGIAVYWMSQARETGQTSGVPDILAFDPIRGMFWVECKAKGGRQSEAQREFQQRCEWAGIPYVIGGLQEVEEWLKEPLRAARTEKPHE
jgi:hypothetical protein